MSGDEVNQARNVNIETGAASGEIDLFSSSLHVSNLLIFGHIHYWSCDILLTDFDIIK